MKIIIKTIENYEGFQHVSKRGHFAIWDFGVWCYLMHPWEVYLRYTCRVYGQEV